MVDTLPFNMESVPAGGLYFTVVPLAAAAAEAPNPPDRMQTQHQNNKMS